MVEHNELQFSIYTFIIHHYRDVSLPNKKSGGDCKTLHTNQRIRWLGPDTSDA